MALMALRQFIPNSDRLGDGSRDSLLHGHPPGHRLGIAKAQDAMRIVPQDVVVPFMIFKTKVLPPFHGADVGKWHPDSLVPRTNFEILRKNFGKLLERATK